jgi:hypothetical protein
MMQQRPGCGYGCTMMISTGTVSASEIGSDTFFTERAAGTASCEFF